jgi:hypothetical protein
MTLHTRVALKGGTTEQAEALFMHLRGILGSEASLAPGHMDGVEIRREKKGEKDTGPYSKGRVYPCDSYSHNFGVGLAAWLNVDFDGDGMTDEPWTYEDQKPEDLQEEKDRIAKDPTTNGWANIKVDFDTAYGYKSPSNGARCSDLHAYLIVQVIDWAKASGLDAKFYNEYQGTWHDIDDAEGLIAIGDPIWGEINSTVARNPNLKPDPAMAWFDYVAKPAIDLHIAQSILGTGAQQNVTKGI